MSEQDHELNAMVMVVQALTPLGDASRSRVLQYATSRFNTNVQAVPAMEVQGAISTDTTTLANGVGAKQIAEYDTLADLYHDAQPNSDAEKALVVSAWLQISEGREGIDSFSVNSALKNLGYPIGNITRALDMLVNQRPALMIQIRKSGVTKQARKLSKVTDAGLKRVRELIARTTQ